MPTPVKVAIIYYSSTGTVDVMARHIEAVAEKAGAEVRRRHVEELVSAEVVESQDQWAEHAAEVEDEPDAAPEDVVWADVVLFGTPTRFGNVASQLKQFLDSLGPQWEAGELADKVYAGFVAVQSQHGGHESTLLALYNTIHHFGGIVVAPGYTDPVKFEEGNPYGVSHAGGPDDQDLTEAERGALVHLTERTVTIARRLRAGAEAESSA